MILPNRRFLCFVLLEITKPSTFLSVISKIERGANAVVMSISPPVTTKHFLYGGGGHDAARGLISRDIAISIMHIKYSVFPL